MRILKSILVFLNFLMLLPFATFAQSRWMPGGSVYFSAQTIRTTQQRDQAREKLNLSIHQIAN